MEDQPLLLFDGVCNLCNRSVQFVIRHDRARVFRFASLQSAAAARALESFGGAEKALAPSRGGADGVTGSAIAVDAGGSMGSVLLIYRGRLYVRSEAVLKVLDILGGAWRITGVFKILPRPLRDTIYDWIARNRYRWFGKRDVCMVPEPGLQDRFLDDEA